jgi:hypothetical protein
MPMQSHLTRQAHFTVSLSICRTNLHQCFQRASRQTGRKNDIGIWLHPLCMMTDAGAKEYNCFRTSAVASPLS